jgi:hypothetical protein
VSQRVEWSNALVAIDFIAEPGAFQDQNGTKNDKAVLVFDGTFAIEGTANEIRAVLYRALAAVSKETS